MLNIQTYLGYNTTASRFSGEDRWSRNQSQKAELSRRKNDAIAYATHVIHIGQNIRRSLWNDRVFYYRFNRASDLRASHIRRRRLCNSKFPKWIRGVRVSQTVANRRTRGRLVAERKRGKERNIARTRRSIFTIILSPGIPESPVFLVSLKAVRERGENGGARTKRERSLHSRFAGGSPDVRSRIRGYANTRLPKYDIPTYSVWEYSGRHID